MLLPIWGEQARTRVSAGEIGTRGKSLGVPDLLDPDLFARESDLLEAFAALGPVSWQPGRPGFWAVLAYEPARRVLEQPQLFSSAFGTGPTSELELPPVYDPAQPPYRSLNLSDPPAHTALRRHLESWLKGRNVSLQAEWFAPLAAGGEVVETVLRAVPCRVLQSLLEVTGEQARELGALARRIAYADQEPGVAWLRWRQAEQELRQQLRSVAGGPGRLLDERDRLFLLRLLVLASLESTTTALTHLLLHLSPERWEQLRQQPAAQAPFVEEVLWHNPPIQRFARVALRDLELAGQAVRRGQRLVVFFRAANRHGGSPQRHLAFGAGPHRCPGASLARRQLRALLQACLQLPECPRLAGNPSYFRSSFTRSPRSFCLVPLASAPESP